MSRFGDELRREREERGVTIDAICAATKVSSQHVAALEAGELEKLPGGVFRRGIARSYVQALGLNEAPWMERFDTTCRAAGLGGESERDWVEFAQNVKRGRAGERGGRGLQWLGVMLLMGLVGVLGWFVWRLARHRYAEAPVTSASSSRSGAATAAPASVDRAE